MEKSALLTGGKSEPAPGAGVGSAEILEQPITGVGVLTLIGVELISVGVGGISVSAEHALMIKRCAANKDEMRRIRFIS